MYLVSLYSRTPHGKGEGQASTQYRAPMPMIVYWVILSRCGWVVELSVQTSKRWRAPQPHLG